MPVYKYTKEITNKKTGKKVKKNAYRCIGSYVDIMGNPQKYHKRGFATEKEAKEWERTFLLSSKEEIDTSITFEELYKLFLEEKKTTVKKRSFDDIKYTCDKHILPFWKKVKINKININMIIKWQNQLLEGKYYSPQKKMEVEYSNSLLENIQTYLKSILRFGANTGRINNVQIIMFKNKKHVEQQKKEMDFWELDEFNQFIETVDDINLNALFNVLYWCGLRLGEALALNWNDVNFNTKTIKITKTWNDHHHEITTPKTQNSYRDVIVPNKCFEALEQLLAYHRHKEGFNMNVFIFGFDKPYDDNYIRRKKELYCKKAEVKIIRIHDFRHSHVSLLINLGFSAFDIAKRVGHTVEQVNETYGHQFKNAQLNMVDKLNSIM